MHLQVRSRTGKSGGGGGMSVHDDDGGEDIAVSATYEPGALVAMLGILADDGFNLRSASGSNVELGGEFAFWVDGRSDDEDEHAAAYAAAELLNAHDYEADVFEVHSGHLNDEKGTLKDFVEQVTEGKLLVKEISVGTPDKEGIPVQIFTAKVRRHRTHD